MVVVAGPDAAVTGLEAELEAKGVAGRRLRTSHAFHSPMMDPILASFADVVRGARLNAPAIPYISNVSGDWITDAEAADPEYYARHLRSAVRFASGIAALAAEPSTVFVEVGPGRSLASLVRAHEAAGRDRLVVTSLRHPNDTSADLDFALAALGQLWLGGIVPDWDPQGERDGRPWRAFYAGERRRRIPLPLYPFQRERYWVEPDAGWGPAVTCPQVAVKTPDTGRWFYAPSWQRIPAAAPPAATVARAHAGTPGGFLVFATGSDLDAALLANLAALGAGEPRVVAPGSDFAATAEGFAVRPGQAGDYDRVVAALQEQEALPETVVHLWSACPGCDFETAADARV